MLPISPRSFIKILNKPTTPRASRYLIRQTNQPYSPFFSVLKKYTNLYLDVFYNQQMSLAYLSQLLVKDYITIKKKLRKFICKYRRRSRKVKRRLKFG